MTLGNSITIEYMVRPMWDDLMNRFNSKVHGEIYDKVRAKVSNSTTDLSEIKQSIELLW